METKKKTSNKFSPEVRERAVRMVIEHQGDHPTQWQAISSIAAKIGCTGETLRHWVRQAERDAGERIIARVEAGADGPDTRFVVTNLNKRNARLLYEDVYCRRGQAENHIKSWKTHLAADRASCTKATANQLWLFLHAGAYWIMWGLRVSMPKRSMWRIAQFSTLRLRLIKLAARVVEMKTMIRIHLPTSCPAQDILRHAINRIPRLVT